MLLPLSILMPGTWCCVCAKYKRPEPVSGWDSWCPNIWTGPSPLAQAASCWAISPGCPQTIPENCPGEPSMDDGVTELFCMPGASLLVVCMQICTLDLSANVDSTAGWTLLLNTYSTVYFLPHFCYPQDMASVQQCAMRSLHLCLITILCSQWMMQVEIVWGSQTENPFCGKQEAEIPRHGLVLCWFSTTKLFLSSFKRRRNFFNMFRCRAGK